MEGSRYAAEQQLALQRAGQDEQANARREMAMQQLEAFRLSSEQQKELMTNLTREQQMNAERAKAQLFLQQQQYAEQKLAMEQQAADQRKSLEEERRKIAERESNRFRARRRSGRRALLSEARLNPEVGVATQENQYGNQSVVAG
jgi:DNA replication protein DnaD